MLILFVILYCKILVALFVLLALKLTFVIFSWNWTLIVIIINWVKQKFSCVNAKNLSWIIDYISRLWPVLLFYKDGFELFLKGVDFWGWEKLLPFCRYVRIIQPYEIRNRIVGQVRSVRTSMCTVLSFFVFILVKQVPWSHSLTSQNRFIFIRLVIALWGLWVKKEKKRTWRFGIKRFKFDSDFLFLYFSRNEEWNDFFKHKMLFSAPSPMIQFRISYFSYFVVKYFLVIYLLLNNSIYEYTHNVHRYVIRVCLLFSLGGEWFMPKGWQTEWGTAMQQLRASNLCGKRIKLVPGTVSYVRVLSVFRPMLEAI